MKSNGSLAFQKFVTVFLSLVMCLCLLSGASWAWFAVNLQSAEQTITAATFAIDVSVMQKDDSAQGFSTTEGEAAVPLAGEGLLTPADATTNTYELAPGGRYTVTLTASGTASGGYCEVTVGQAAYETVQLLPGTTIRFDVSNDTAAAASIRFDTKWGTPAEASLILSADGTYSWNGSEVVVPVGTSEETPVEPGNELKQPETTDPVADAPEGEPTDGTPPATEEEKDITEPDAGATEEKNTTPSEGESSSIEGSSAEQGTPEEGAGTATPNTNATGEEIQ